MSVGLAAKSNDVGLWSDPSGLVQMNDDSKNLFETFSGASRDKASGKVPCALHSRLIELDLDYHSFGCYSPIKCCH